MFQLTAARRRLAAIIFTTHPCIMFQLTAARRRLADSRLSVLPTSCFNSQPPEGGWVRRPAVSRQLVRFNSQPPEGGWLLLAENRVLLPAEKAAAQQHTGKLLALLADKMVMSNA